jgi:hypothetical protein
MSEARRQQMRLSMLPHLTGKFDPQNFIRTGACIDHSHDPLPDTPAMQQAREEWERDQEIIAERMRMRHE